MINDLRCSDRGFARRRHAELAVRGRQGSKGGADKHFCGKHFKAKNKNIQRQCYRRDSNCLV